MVATNFEKAKGAHIASKCSSSLNALRKSRQKCESR